MRRLCLIILCLPLNLIIASITIESFKMCEDKDYPIKFIANFTNKGQHQIMYLDLYMNVTLDNHFMHFNQDFSAVAAGEMFSWSYLEYGAYDLYQSLWNDYTHCEKEDPWIGNLKSTYTIEVSIDGKEYKRLFTIRNKLCYGLNLNFGEFAYRLMRSAGLPQKCPIPKGHYVIRNQEIDFNNFRIPQFPMGYIKTIMVVFDDAKNVVNCNIAYLQNLS